MVVMLSAGTQTISAIHKGGGTQEMEPQSKDELIQGLLDELARNEALIERLDMVLEGEGVYDRWPILADDVFEQQWRNATVMRKVRREGGCSV
jgi:hypothetical protein